MSSGPTARTARYRASCAPWAIAGMTSSTLCRAANVSSSGMTRTAVELDVFLDKIKMCHELRLRDRLTVDDITLAPVDLLLTKLQVVQTNERDLKDSAALILDCEIDAHRLAQMLGSDWGWWRTATEVLAKVDAYVAAQTDFARRDEGRANIARLRQSIDAQPKSIGWKARARIGDRIRWYELPEEDYQ